MLQAAAARMDKIMKTLLALIMTVALSATAQTTNEPPKSPSSFFETSTLWFTSFNTNNIWNQRGVLEAGVDSISKTDTHLANSLRLSYDVWKNVSAELMARDSGVAGTWVSGTAGIGYNFKVWDAKLTLIGLGGREFIEERWMGEFHIQASKKVAKYTHAFVRLGARVPVGSQIYSGGVGFSF